MSVTSSTKRCIIADDLRASRTLLQKWIGACGYICETTENGEEAWNAIVKSVPDLVVTDIEMPGASGLDLLCSMRSHLAIEFRSIPVLVISSLIDDDIRQFVHDVGGTFFLPKPLEMEATQRVVNHLADLTSVPIELKPVELSTRHDPASRISPTLRRLYRDVQTNGPRFR